MADFAATTMAQLIQTGVGLGMTATIDKQLARFGIATGANDPQLQQKLAAADAGLLNWLATQLAAAIFNHA